MKKVTFNTRLEAIDWIAAQVENEGQFELLREQLNYNEIYTGELFIDMKDDLPEIALLDQNK